MSTADPSWADHPHESNAWGERTVSVDVDERRTDHPHARGENEAVATGSQVAAADHPHAAWGRTSRRSAGTQRDQGPSPRARGENDASRCILPPTWADHPHARRGRTSGGGGLWRAPHFLVHLIRETALSI